MGKIIAVYGDTHGEAKNSDKVDVQHIERRLHVLVVEKRKRTTVIHGVSWRWP